MEIARHISPDGLLQLVVLKDETAGLTVGFEGGESHTHGDVLIGEYGGIGEPIASPSQAVERYVAEILADRMKIMVVRKEGVFVDAWALPYEVVDPHGQLAQGEELEIRYWSGNGKVGG